LNDGIHVKQVCRQKAVAMVYRSHVSSVVHAQPRNQTVSNNGFINDEC